MRFPSTICRLFAVGFNAHSLRLLRRGGPVVCSVVVRRAFDVIACVWSPLLACVETAATRRWFLCRSACGFRRRSAGCLRSGSTRTRSVFCGVVDPSFAASLYGARSTSSRVSGRRRSPVLRPPRCCAGCRAVRRALPVDALQAVCGRVQRALAVRFPSTICRLFAVGFNAHSLRLLRRGGPVVCSVVVRRAFDVIACVWSPSLACVETIVMLRWLSCRSACGFRRRSTRRPRSGSTCTCQAVPVDDLQAVCGRVQRALPPSSAAWWTCRLQRRCTARVRRHRVCLVAFARLRWDHRDAALVVVPFGVRFPSTICTPSAVEFNVYVLRRGRVACSLAVPRAAIPFNASCVRGEHGSRRSTSRRLEFGLRGPPVRQFALLVRVGRTTVSSPRPSTSATV